LGSPASRWRLGASGSPPNGWTALPTSPALGLRKIGDEKIAEVVTIARTKSRSLRTS
jgi:hypothetical protein